MERAIAARTCTKKVIAWQASGKTHLIGSSEFFGNWTLSNQNHVGLGCILDIVIFIPCICLSLSLSICTYISRAGPHDQNASATATLSDSTPTDTPAQGGVRASVRGNVRPSVGGSVRGSLVGKGARPKGRASTMAKQGVNKAAGKLLDARQSWVGEISRRGGVSDVWEREQPRISMMFPGMG